MKKLMFADHFRGILFHEKPFVLIGFAQHVGFREIP